MSTSLAEETDTVLEPVASMSAVAICLSAWQQARQARA